MNCFYVIAALLLLGRADVLSQEIDPEKEIRSLMANQEKCWNSGDLECFMVGYWESDSLMFVNKEKVIYGYDNILERYKRTYPNPDSMGKLKFDFMAFDAISADAYFVIGKYHLTREMGDLEGHFSLLWKKINGNWVIVADHSS